MSQADANREGLGIDLDIVVARLRRAAVHRDDDARQPLLQGRTKGGRNRGVDLSLRLLEKVDCCLQRLLQHNDSLELLPGFIKFSLGFGDALQLRALTRSKLSLPGS